jgi:hypothetical protein
MRSGNPKLYKGARARNFKMHTPCEYATHYSGVTRLALLREDHRMRIS